MRALMAGALGALALMLPLFVAHAQAPDSDLRATIQAQLMSDPRTSSLSEAQLDAMVSVLAQEAQKRGITAGDLTYRPQHAFGATIAETVEDICQGIPSISCAFDVALGFLGPNTFIAYTLGAASMALVWLLAEMLHHRRYVVQSVQQTPQEAATPPPPPPPMTPPSA